MQKKVHLLKKKNFPILVLYNGETITVHDGETTSFKFSKSDFPLKNLQTNTTIYKKTQELSTKELINCIKKIKGNNFTTSQTGIENCSTENINNIYKEFYKRLIIPLYIPLLTLVPFLIIFSSKESVSYNKLKILTFLIGLFSIILSETTIRFISEIFLSEFAKINKPFFFKLPDAIFLRGKLCNCIFNSF